MDKKLYYVSRTDVTYFDEFSSMVICATSEEEALTMLPDSKDFSVNNKSNEEWLSYPRTVRFIGWAYEDIPVGTIIISSFHAG